MNSHRRVRSILRSTAGLSLVEVMITLGVASVMLASILTLVNYSNKSVKNVSTNSEWNMFIANVSQALTAESDGCSGAFAPNLYNGNTPVPTGNTLLSAGLGITAPTGNGSRRTFTNQAVMLRRLNGGTVNTSSRALIEARTTGGANNYGGAFTVTGFELVADQARWTTPLATTQINGAQYVLRPVLLFINGTKPGAGTVNMPMGGNTLRNDVGIPLTIITGPGTASTTVHSCFSTQDLATRACQELGGTYLNPAPTNGSPRCVIAPVRFTGPAAPNGGAPGTLNGRIALLDGNMATPGTATDTAIGIDKTGGIRNLWFNVASGSAVGNGTRTRFTWQNNSIAAMTLEPLDTGAGTALSIGTPGTGTGAHASLHFGVVNGFEYIRSIREDGHVDENNLELGTNNRRRLNIGFNGVMHIPGADFNAATNPTSAMTLRLGNQPSGSTAVPGMLEAFWSANNLPPYSRIRLQVNPDLYPFTNGLDFGYTASGIGSGSFSLRRPAAAGGGGGDFNLSTHLGARVIGYDASAAEVGVLEINGNGVRLENRSNLPTVLSVDGQTHIRLSGGAPRSVQLGGPGIGVSILGNGGSGGNIPYDCHLVIAQPAGFCFTNGGGGETHCGVLCPAGEVAVGGGGLCGNNQALHWSLPAVPNGATTRGADPGETPSAWQVGCNNGVVAMKASVMCCKQ